MANSIARRQPAITFILSCRIKREATSKVRKNESHAYDWFHGIDELVMASSVASAQTPTSQAELVTVENYNRAQTDVYFAGVVKNGGFGKFRAGRRLALPAPQGISPAN